jgi:cytidyltransferase-like protein
MMQVHYGTEQLPTFSKSVLTIGTFDGVHEGHKKLIRNLNNVARELNGESIIITFHPHPRKIINPDQSLQLLNTLEEKIQLLSKTGVNHLVIVPFTKEYSEIPADDYIENFLIRNFNRTEL